MSKTSLIIKREFITRVKKKSFLIMTILGPLLFAALIIAPALLASLPDGPKTIVVVDVPSILLPEKGNNKYILKYLPRKEFDLDKAKDFLRNSNDDVLLYIPTGEGWDPDFFKNNIKVFGKEDISLGMQSYLEDLLERKINDQKLLAQGVDPEIVAQTKTTVNLKTFTLKEETTGVAGEQASATPVKMAVGYVAGIMIYFFVFFYTSQVMRGVIEEKTNRIIEVIISSVKPFQLMMGKVVGIGAVGLLQFLIWVILSGVIYAVAAATILKDKLNPEVLAGQGAEEAMQMAEGMEVMQMLATINYPVVIGAFLFFFLGGYLLYAALFAAVGSAVDNETDSQQFMLPLTLPLILAIVVTSKVIDDPNGPIAFWFSMIPLTSPVVMMVRVPFGVPIWQLALSITLLIGAFIAATWLAGRIYRVGILMYGKKPTWGELLKWITYKS